MRLPDQGRRRVALIAIVVVAVVGVTAFVVTQIACGCGGGPSSPVVGLVVGVDATGLTEVHGFTLRPDGGGANLDFTIGPLENPTQFPPGHLKAHEASGSPVRVYFLRESSGELVAYRLEDALPPSPSAPSVPSSSP